MNLDSVWGLGFGAALFLAVILGLFYVKKVIRNRYFPEDAGRERSEAMAELMAFQASLQQKADQGSSGEDEGSQTGGGDPEEQGPSDR